MLHPLGHRALDQAAAGGGVVAVIFERVADRFRHYHRPGEVHDRGDPVIADRGADLVLIGDIGDD